LGTNHSIFFGVGWRFGTPRNSSVKKPIVDVVVSRGAKRVTDETVFGSKEIFIPLDENNRKWTIQLAAYQGIDNASEKRLALQKLFNGNNFNAKLAVIKIGKLHKLIIDKKYIDKATAKSVAKNIYDLFGIESFVTSLNRANTIND
jgi:hypothetical protein